MNSSSRNIDTASPLSSEHHEPGVVINGTYVPVEIVSTPESINKGLGHRRILEASSGMLFLFDHNAIFKFWMKGMRFPLDIIWIDADRRIIDITERVPVVPLFTRPIFYSPREAARYVLEVNAGFSTARGIRVGNVVDFISIAI